MSLGLFKAGDKGGKGISAFMGFHRPACQEFEEAQESPWGVFCLALGALLASMHLAGLFLEQDSVTEGRTVDVSAMGTPDGSGSCPEHPSPVGLS